MKRWVLLLILLGLLVPAVHAQSIVFITRHAEKASDGGKDPNLSDAGRARAEKLVKILKDAGIAMIFATEFKRTQETAAPLAKALGLNVTKVDAKDVAALALKLRELKGNAVVVGHGDTIPNLIAALGIDSPVKIEDNDYDNLFVVVLDEKPRLLRLHYGF
jgi:2,3-bisphosphoglycerate-dependent phosphoglycerate mutase